jgi:hypothetical protein
MVNAGHVLSINEHFQGNTRGGIISWFENDSKENASYLVVDLGCRRY